MKTRALRAVGVALLTGGCAVAAARHTTLDSRQPTRIIDQTTLVGDADPVLWKKVLDVLPARPQRIQVLDLDSLTPAARERVRGLDGFVLPGHTTIVVVRQGATLTQAEFGDAVDWLILASLVWHEMAHLKGLDERAALKEEQALWQRFVTTGLASHDIGLRYIARLRESGS